MIPPPGSLWNPLVPLPNIASRGPPSLHQLNRAHVKPIPGEHFLKNQRPPLFRRRGVEALQHLRQCLQGRVVGRGLQVGVGIRQIRGPQPRLAGEIEVDGVEAPLTNQEFSQDRLHGGNPCIHPRLVGKAPTVKMGAERFTEHVQPIHLRSRVKPKISVATDIGIRSQPGKPHVGMGLVGHCAHKKMQPASWLVACLRSVALTKNVKVPSVQSVTTEISTRRLVDFDDLGSLGP